MLYSYLLDNYFSYLVIFSAAYVGTLETKKDLFAALDRGQTKKHIDNYITAYYCPEILIATKD